MAVDLARLERLTVVCKELEGAVNAHCAAKLNSEMGEQKPLLPSKEQDEVSLASTWTESPVALPGDPCHGRDASFHTRCASASDVQPRIEAAIVPGELDSMRLFPLLSLKPENSQDPMAQLRFVFSAYQVPRGAAFALFMNSLQRKRVVDTYLIPFEYEHVRPDQDVVFGLTGPLEAACRLFKKFLVRDGRKSLTGKPYRIHCLVPADLHLACFTSGPRSSWSSTRKRIEGTDESLLTIESKSLRTLLTATKSIGEGLSMQEDSLHCTFYRGGYPSVIPDNRSNDQELHLSSKGPFLGRPENPPENTLDVGGMPRFGLSLLLNHVHAHAVSGEEGVLIRLLLTILGSRFRISSYRLKTPGGTFFVYEIGAHDLDTLERTVIELTRWTERPALASEWTLRLLLPRGVSQVLQSQSATQDWRLREIFGCGLDETIGCTIAGSSGRRGIQEAVRGILLMLYCGLNDDAGRWPPNQ